VMTSDKLLPRRKIARVNISNRRANNEYSYDVIFVIHDDTNTQQNKKPTTTTTTREGILAAGPSSRRADEPTRASSRCSCATEQKSKQRSIAGSFRLLGFSYERRRKEQRHYADGVVEAAAVGAAAAVAFSLAPGDDDDGDPIPRLDRGSCRRRRRLLLLYDFDAY